MEGNIKLLSVPLLILVAIIVLMLFSVKIIVGKISSLNSDLAKANENHNSLQQKLNSLQQIAPSISDDSANLLAAIPGQNSVIDAIMTLKYEASTLNLAITSLTSNSTNPIPGNQINTTEIDFQISGTYPNLFSLMEKLKNSAPIVHFSSIKIKSDSPDTDIYTLKASIQSYWASLPTSIPSITEPIQDFTPEEQKIMSSTAKLERPVVNIGESSSTSTSSASGKTNPFQ